MASCPVNHTYDALFLAAGQAYGVDPALIKAHAAQESGFDPGAYRAEPRIGDASYGLMQLLYATAVALGYSGARPTVTDQQNLTGLYAPGVNVPLAARLVKQNLDGSGGNLDTAIAAYNEGLLRAIDDAPNYRTFDPNYVANVKACYAAYQADFAPPDSSSGPTAAGVTGGIGMSQATIALLLAGVAAALTWLVRKWAP